MKPWRFARLGLTAALLAVAGVAAAQTEPAPTAIALDTEQTIGDVGIACTGIGQSKDDPRWKAYPIRLEFANPAGDLLANVAVTLSTGSGRVLATVTCEGPWILFRGAPGTYKVDAWMPGQGFKHQMGTFSPPAGGLRIVSLRFPRSLSARGTRVTLTLHSYWRATAPYRVRIGLNLKGLAFDYAPVNLLAAQQRGEVYGALNPQHLVPTLEADGLALTQSFAILEWLDETHPSPPFLLEAPADRAVVRAMAAVVACDIHPLNNLRVLQALNDLGHPMGGPEQAAWGARWINDGFAALEPMVARHGGGFAFGATPTLADCCLIPQIWSSSRFEVDMTAYPALAAVAARAAEHPAFMAAHPDRQPDAA